MASSMICCSQFKNKRENMNKAFLKYIFALLLFGSNGIAASFIELSSLQIVLLRTGIGSLLLLALFLLGGGKFRFYKHRRAFSFLVVSGIAMGTSWLFLYEAYGRIGVGVASLLYYCGPVIVMALSPLLFGERLTANKAVGFLSVLAGVVFINGNAFNGGGDVWGVVCGLISAVMYAFMVICNKKAKDIEGLENATLQLVIAFLSVAVAAGLKRGYAMEISSASVLPILVLGLLNTGVGCYLYFSSIGRLKVQTVAVCGYLEPLSAVVFSALFLRETMLPLQVVGAVLVIGGAMYGELVKRD